jgi:hypothetical protein
MSPESRLFVVAGLLALAFARGSHTSTGSMTLNAAGAAAATGAATPAPISYLMSEPGTTEATERVAQMLAAIAVLQHPPVETCRQRRLLVLQFPSSSFEGMGSILKQIMLGLGEAAYSNRTVVWGLDLPHMFEHSRGAWQEDGRPNERGINLDCRGWRNQGGGPYSCFFQSLSSCSLAHATAAELALLGVNGFDDSARVRLQEVRRGAVAYAGPPPGRFRENTMTSSERGYAAPSLQLRYQWAGALSAYAFRLKPDLLSAFARRRTALGWVDPVWAMHVRHGDVKALADVYENRRVFQFETYFEAIRNMSQRAEGAGAPLPATLFIASDSMETDDAVKAGAMFLRESDDWGVPAGATEQSSAPLPLIVHQKKHFRTPHGSHTVASDGGCVDSTCALRPETVLSYRYSNYAKDKEIIAPYSGLMRVLLESVEDIALLALADVQVSQATSHFSTLGALLSWARTGAPRAGADVLFLDHDGIASGQFITGFLHGALNRTSLVLPELGWARWELLKRKFMEAIPLDGSEPHPVKGGKGGRGGAPFAAGGAFKLVGGLPLMPPAVVEFETRTWLGEEGTSGACVPGHAPSRAVRPRGSEGRGLPAADCPPSTRWAPWVGACPRPLPRTAAGNATALVAHIIHLIDMGASHNEWHPGQSVACWLSGLEMVHKLRAVAGPDFRYGDAQMPIEEIVDVLQGNLKAVAREHMFPYARSSEHTSQLMKDNLGVSVVVPELSPTWYDSV